MDLRFELIIAAKLFLSIVLGCIIGFERETSHKDAGIRTFGAITLASCLFVAIASHLTDDKSAIARMLAAIATGLGFIGAGLSFKDKSNSLMGLTTSSALWATAAVGSAVALNMYVLAIFSTVLIYILLSLNKFTWFRKIIKSNISNKSKHDEGNDV
ncbi:MgtC/SapB family protein [Epilithonimonas vandammei]|uniref:MgtC/SapB family protein n=4 Tax=Chryseobacterium group TaxID=2782232 RepID=A0A3G8Y801_9FLAO|nr:MgtC/SapB family protein [Chryseobacterium sp. G0186]AZB36475.1 MgtC/SapB family protein [Chryseobacterium bernardetii]AZI41315.1 MgtC/SapB family protein [Epilithonimonas vandammei]KNB62674.1 membrane protein [Chryseobacterium sp. Hurlbut01]NMR35247.1 MgtC/SapB family protein [Chryseobacterium aquaticum]NRQ47316.1 MgtC/SapB family protein [Chryseobacterium sp. C-204]QQY34802.1 MgtC/SapB family protein [Chryseobacterium gleum]TLX25259.1 MgtC/SapB family protein [Chryseobacterium indologen